MSVRVEDKAVCTMKEEDRAMIMKAWKVKGCHNRKDKRTCSPRMTKLTMYYLCGWVMRSIPMDGERAGGRIAMGCTNNGEHDIPRARPCGEERVVHSEISTGRVDGVEQQWSRHTYNIGPDLVSVDAYDEMTLRVWRMAGRIGRWSEFWDVGDVAGACASGAAAVHAG